jgi:VanZ family protein
MSASATAPGARYGGAVVAWIALIAYASLYPFLPLRLPGVDTLKAVFAVPRAALAYDVVWNVLAYIPLGVLAYLYFHERAPSAQPKLRAIGFAAAFSAAMETCQLFVPGRVASLYDVLSNAAGAALGTAIFLEPFASAVTRPLAQLRERVVIPGTVGDTGLMLVGLWLLAQCNPGLPFFGAGDVAVAALGGEPDPSRVLPWLAVALSLCGFGLFISTLVRAGTGSLRSTLVLLSIALWLKFVGASVMLQPHFAESWVSSGRVAGLAAGMVAFIALRKLPRAGRIYLALLTLMAGDLFSKIFGAYSSLDDFLRLFRWPYGQLASFATLTRFLHELWPLAALVFLIDLFLHERRSPFAG